MPTMAVPGVTAVRFAVIVTGEPADALPGLTDALNVKLGRPSETLSAVATG